MITISHYLAVGAVLFTLGLIGFLTRRNLIVMFLSAEMMLQGVAINFVAFSRHHGNMHGQVFTLFIIAVAACEAGIALALFLSLYRKKRTLDVSVWQDLREAGIDETTDAQPLTTTPEDADPILTKAGIAPKRPLEETNV
ncbi:NADH-quinone oxidoreductase subunit NuoK [Zavarzinella formosa]|uniref:NADH-quinone oxidoreductase subunit NuoK n=1 Tax=Zavarzinella formosa TaxID=360055 RepID=UPI000300E939|nr:NADH-quinone oxidoreductase subunit NuoK [Zavarzinella formosa]